MEKTDLSKIKKRNLSERRRIQEKYTKLGYENSNLNIIEISKRSKWELPDEISLHENTVSKGISLFEITPKEVHKILENQRFMENKDFVKKHQNIYDGDDDDEKQE